MIFRKGVVVIFVIASAVVAETRGAPIPIPRAYYDFEYIAGGEILQNVVNPAAFSGYLGTSSSDAARNPVIVPGLNGSGAALRFDGSDIARIPSLVTDTNADRIDEDVFSGAFSVFARVDTPNVAQMNVVNADRGPLSTSVRGWYMDFSNSTQNGSGEYLLRPRFTTGGGPTLHPSGTETTNYQVVDSYGIVWTPDPTPGGAADGLMEIYINGVLFASRTHNWASPYVGEAGFNIGFGNGVSSGGGITIDDLAVWDRALTGAQMFQVHTQGVPVPEPSTWVLLAGGVLGLSLWKSGRRKKCAGPVLR